MKKVCLVEPVLTNYLAPVLEELSEFCAVDVLASPVATGDSFGQVSLRTSPHLRQFAVKTIKVLGSSRFGMYQCGLVRYLIRERPDALIVSANPRYISFWTSLLCARILGIPSYAHGHGLYKKTRVSFFHKWMYFVLFRLVQSYICYAPIVAATFLANGFDQKKLSIAENSIVNKFRVAPQEKTGKEMGVLFIGRLREGCNIGRLKRAIERLRIEDGMPIVLHIVGDGRRRDELGPAPLPPWLIHYGLVYDLEVIQTISRDCAIGCYPGSAGLSTVHYMSLSLVPVVHDNLASHQGPEPSYVEQKTNGILFAFDKGNRDDDLYRSLQWLFRNTDEIKRLQQQAYRTFCDLTTPSLANRLLRIIFPGEIGKTGTNMLE
jgi:hypothetical protein